MERDNMGKTELIKKISQRTGFTRDICEAVVDAMVEDIKEALVDGDNVMIKGFMSFELGTMKERVGRNPQTGEMISYPAVRKVNCKLSRAIKDAVSGKVIDDV